jgi:hypothetical protein
MIEGEVSFLGLFFFGICGVVVCEKETEGDSYCLVSTGVFASYSVWFTYFSIYGLRV